jgi:ferric-dicitrate binding protein FerR (iron transport regulator)
MNSENQHIDPAGLLPKVLSGEATPDEIKVVSEWISENEANRKEYESLRILWNITAPSEKNEIDIDAEWQKMETAVTPVRKLSRGFVNFLKVAASIILISALAFYGIRLATVKIMRSPAAEIANYELPDGTKVSLNAGSKISYKKGFGISHRNLELNGEGFFEVTRSQTPFIIDAGVASVRVTGTKFNVSAYQNDQKPRVTVTEGSVRFYDSGKPEIQVELNAGETGTYNTDEKKVVKELSVDLNDFAWRTGIIEFNNTPLDVVTDVLEKTYHIPFKVDSTVLKCTITVRFENQDADSVLNVLRSTLDVNITRKGKQVLITGDGC